MRELESDWIKFMKFIDLVEKDFFLYGDEVGVDARILESEYESS